MPIIMCPIKLTQKRILIFSKTEHPLWTYKNLNLGFVAVYKNLFENPYRFYIMLMAEVERG
jgi:hypothetical protein